jgi:phosphoribosylaminoimidazole (AIR) synthetase
MAQFKEYVKNDFLYSKYNEEINETTCDSSTNTYTGNVVTLETGNLGDALCLNKNLADEIINKTQSHPGTYQRYVDAQGFSDTSMLNIFNLGIGIIGAALFIRKTYK